MTETTVGIVVVAAGSGSRLAAGIPKAFATVGNRTILEHCLRGLAEVAGTQIVVVAPESHVDAARQIAGTATVVAGGATRQASVAAGLAALVASVDVVLVHDAARAFTPSAMVERVITAVRETGAGVVPSLPVSDTIKRVDGVAVLGTVDRADLVRVQTPQGFPRARLEAAYASATTDYTDDAALFAAAGHAVEVVPGDAQAFKITTPADLRRAQYELAEHETEHPMSVDFRTGVGMDVHAYDAGAPLWLGGLYWPNEVGLSGHSDGDALCHAICDALLSAAGLGDIGGRFGTSDPKFAGAHGEVFIAETVVLVEGSGFAIGNVSVQLIANTPRLGARRSELESHLSTLLGAPVSVAATTSDGLGFTGRGEGVAVIATALISAR
jgi:2-C-methyl-D-erythritol 4-phosphate cytidylyltransferase/2-C-methyl-D-erythritol 2,4-cyclodiphosphate synthase